MPGTETTDLEFRDRISRTKEVLVRHRFAMSAVPEIAAAFGVSIRTAYRYKAKAEREIKADIDLTDEEAAQLLVDGLLEIFHAPGTKAAVRLRALDMLARAKGAYRPKKIEVSSPLSHLDDDALREVAAELGLDTQEAAPAATPGTAPKGTS